MYLWVFQKSNTTTMSRSVLFIPRMFSHSTRSVCTFPNTAASTDRKLLWTFNLVRRSLKCRMTPRSSPSYSMVSFLPGSMRLNATQLAPRQTKRSVYAFNGNATLWMHFHCTSSAHSQQTTASLHVYSHLTCINTVQLALLPGICSMVHG